MWFISRSGFKEIVQENFYVFTRMLLKKETFPG